MARNFVAASSNKLSVGSVAASSLGQNMTVACWLKTPTASHTGKMVGKWGSTVSQNYLLQLSSGKVLLALLDSTGGGHTVTGLTTLSTNTWYHVAGTYDGSTMRAYVNGVQDNTTVASFTAQTASYPLWFGTDNSATSFFNGTIAEIVLYAATLTASELKALAMGASPYAVHPDSLKGYWPLLGDSPEADYSSNRNSATITTGTTVVAHPPVFGRLARGQQPVPDKVTASSVQHTLLLLGAG